jgi:FixJ family two-component response regulator
MNPPAQVVHVVDDDPSFRKSVSRLLQAAGYEVQSHASARDCLQAGPAEGAACVLADLNMPGINGIEFQETLLRTERPVPVILLTAHGDIPTTVRAMRNGAVDFLTKPVDKEELFDAIRRAFAGEAALRRRHDEQCTNRAKYESLTTREKEVLAHVIAGKLNKQIAFELGTGERNVKAHRANMMRKLGVRSVAEVTRLADGLGLEPR